MNRQRLVQHLESPVGRWLPMVAWAALIFGFSATPNLRFAPDDLVDLVVRKAGHAAIYGALALLTTRAIGARDRRGLAAILVCALYATSDELHQSFVAGRHGSAIDVAIDTLGACAAITLAAFVGDRRLRRGGR